MEWRGPLREMLPALEIALTRPSKPDRAVARLPRGAFVELRRVDGRRRVRVIRTGRPVTPEQLRGWELELATFATHLGIRGWPRRVSPMKVGVAVVWHEPDAGVQMELG